MILCCSFTAARVAPVAIFCLAALNSDLLPPISQTTVGYRGRIFPRWCLKTQDGEGLISFILEIAKLLCRSRVLVREIESNTDRGGCSAHPCLCFYHQISVHPTSYHFFWLFTKHLLFLTQLSHAIDWKKTTNNYCFVFFNLREFFWTTCTAKDEITWHQV